MTEMLLTGVLRAAEDGEFDPTVVSPGFAGFLITALVALAVVFLGFDMVRRVRRSRYREEIRLKLEAELAEREEAERGTPEQGGVAADAEPVDTGAADAKPVVDEPAAPEPAGPDTDPSANDHR